MSKLMAIEVWSRRSNHPAITFWACGEGEAPPESENVLIEALWRPLVFVADVIDDLLRQRGVGELVPIDRVVRVLDGGRRTAMAA